MTKPVSPEDRQKYDQVFMQVISSVQAEAQATRPQGSGAIAQMFHKEQVSTALQAAAALIAGWNAGQIDTRAIARGAGALRGLGLEDAAARLENLIRIDEV
ncbi:hypothetical protein HNR42_002349 [Deinobacterium chartae]|uniref:Uncharacterized protein n=1 Tax=Deinobacterium chartae TaxID=521158 RepID=A0A841I1P8_9DEIO|nr:hypothetical protein [Deinobacterium chartae]MBB6098914.1 hypothetical protein [Deinobacterium chartae]